MAAVEPDTAFGPAIPAKKIANVTGTVTSAASQVVPLTSVPMISTTLPATARQRCATNLSFLVPPKFAITSVANPPNVANSAICGSPMTLKVSANSDGTTMAARTARIAAGTDQVGFHQAGWFAPTGVRCATLTILRSGTRAALRGEQADHRGTQRRHPPRCGLASGGEVVSGRLDHFQVGLDLGFGAAGTDDDPRLPQRVAQHVGRRQPGAGVREVRDRLDGQAADGCRGSGPDPAHDLAGLRDPQRQLLGQVHSMRAFEVVVGVAERTAGRLGGGGAAEGGARRADDALVADHLTD